MDAEYCDQPACICLYGRLSPELRDQFSPIFVRVVPGALLVRFSSGGVAMLCASGFAEDVMFTDVGPYSVFQHRGGV